MSNQLDIRIDVSRARSGAVTSAHGVTADELREIEPRVLKAHEQLLREREEKKYGFFDLYKHDAVFADIREKAAHFSSFGYENLVVLGIGGSALGITALNTALNLPYWNMLSRAARKGRPRLFVMDNIDPDTFKVMMRLCPPKKTLYNVISKSGETAETICQLLIIVEKLEKEVGAAAMKDHLVVTTSPKGPNAPKSLLHPVAETYNLVSFEIPLNVGGRFSVFSPVGMFPAAMLGMDLDGLREGCARMDIRCSLPSVTLNSAYLRAVYHYLLDTRKGKHIAVMMPYSDALRDIADWYRQLWAESLGKRFAMDGTEVFAGQTPVKALGATDQHSQIQLYREGPNDKIITMIDVQRFSSTLKVPDVLPQISGVDYLRGKTMNRLMNAEFLGTMDALKASHRPVIRITFPRITPSTVAQLLYMLEVETAMAGKLYRVNAFDQPGVEEGKKNARKRMGGE